MSSPYVRRRRLVDEPSRLRDEHGYSADKMAKVTCLSKQQVSRLSGYRVRSDSDKIMRVLDHFQVGHDCWQQITTIAHDAQERDCWERHARQMCLHQVIYPTTFDTQRALDARGTRQRFLPQPAGPAHEVAINELTVRRLAAPTRFVASQLDHIVRLGHHHGNLTIRVLPTTAQIEGHTVPRTAFSIYRYPDPDDPVAVAFDAVTSDLALTDQAEIDSYLNLYQRLQDAALSPLDSLDFPASMAEELPHEVEG